MLYALLGICVLLLVGIGAIRISYDGRNREELQRRADGGDETMLAVLRRETLVPDLITLHRLVTALLIVALTLLATHIYGPWVGVLLTIGILLVYGAVSRLRIVGRGMQRLYQAAEPKLLGWIDRTPYIWKVIRGVTPGVLPDQKLESTTQLLDLVQHSRGILSPEQKLLIRHGLAFDHKTVKEIMTPRAAIDSVAATELLGPLVLDDLHKTGHSRFPVVEGDIDHIVGILYLRDLLVVDAGKKTMTVRKVMEPRVLYIKESQPLTDALAAFLNAQRDLFIVINEYQETVGLLSIQDVVDTLFGRQLIDERDAHENIRAVAERSSL